MATTAEFQITDYDGRQHFYYRFADAHPRERTGVFVNFPRGDRDFRLETFVRRLDLEKSSKDYWVDLHYEMDLSKRIIKVYSGVYDDVDFNGSFEEAIRFFADEDYSEKDALDAFPEASYLHTILFSGFLDEIWVVIRAIRKEVPHLEYDYYSHRILYVGDNINFYQYHDFIDFPPCSMNRDPELADDAYANARRAGIRIYFNNTVTGEPFTLMYMLALGRDGYVLPLTEKFFRYGEEPDDITKQEELAMLVKHISMCDPKSLRARNYLYGIHSEKELAELRDATRNGK